MTTETTYTGLYLLYDETEGNCYGEYSSVEEAVSCAACLRERDYYLTTSLETGRETVLDCEAFAEALEAYWAEKED